MMSLMRLKAVFFSLLFFPAVSANSDTDISNTIIDEITEFIVFISDIVKEYLIEPPFRILKNLFGGVATSIEAVGVGMFSGAKGAMDVAWQELSGFLGFLGPLAPWVASVVIWGTIVISIYYIFDIILDMIFSKPFERESED